MTATNHAITGSAIALLVKEPALALPLALLSHFICDALPHFGPSSYEDRVKNKSLFHKILLFDAIFLSCFLLFLILSGASLLVFACVFLAGSPDLVWAYRYIFKEDFGKKPFPPKNAFSRFHSGIQWSQTLIPGFYIELAYSLVVLVITVRLL